MSAPALWTVDDMAAAMGAKRQSALPSAISGLSIERRTIGAGEAFFALADRRDGHEFVAAALAAKAGTRGRRRRTARRHAEGRAASRSCRTCSPLCARSPPRRGRVRTPR